MSHLEEHMIAFPGNALEPVDRQGLGARGEGLRRCHGCALQTQGRSGWIVQWGAGWPVESRQVGCLPLPSRIRIGSRAGKLEQP